MFVRVFASLIVLVAVEAKGRARGHIRSQKKHERILIEPFLNNSIRPAPLSEADRATVQSASPRVIIVGAGAAGIGAAEYLAANGVTDFLILEASDRIGGRMSLALIPQDVQDQFGGNFYYENGAMWIHGADQFNPMLELAAKENMNLVPTDWEDYVVLSATGENVTEEYDERWEMYAEALNASLELADEMMEENSRGSSFANDISLSSGLSLYGWEKSSEVDEVVEWSEVDFEFADFASATSLTYHQRFTYDDFGDSDHVFSDPRGYAHIFERLFNNITNGTQDDHIEFNKAVVGVDYTNQAQVTVSTADGGSFQADYVIVTSSISTWSSIAFTPQLPQRKSEATVDMVMAQYVKVVAVYPPDTEPFWPETLLTYTAGDPRWTGLINLGVLLDDETFNTSLSSHVTGYEADNMLHMSLAEIEADFVAMTRRLFGPDVPSPMWFHVPNWREDPLQGGAYTNWPPSLSETDFELLRGAVDRLYFAGEGLSERYGGFVHGGYLTGQDKASFIVDRVVAETNGVACGEACKQATDFLPTSGCTYPSATNHNPQATLDDGSCFFGPNTCCTPGEMCNGGTADCVCSFDKYCCETAWDEQCTFEAQEWCGLSC